MRSSTAIAVLAVLAAGAVGGMVAVEARNPGRDVRTGAVTTLTAPGSASDVPVLSGQAGASSGDLMRPAAGTPIRIVPVLDWNRKATTPLLGGRDCVAEPRSCHNGAEGIDVVYAAPADIPAGPLRASVLTDGGCEPDRDGASHCLNRLRTAAGAVISVRNDHRLANEPCLAPGEHVIVAPGATAAGMLPRLRALAADRGGAWPSTAGLVTGSCVVSDAGLKRAGITRAQLACSRPQA